MKKTEKLLNSSHKSAENGHRLASICQEDLKIKSRIDFTHTSKKITTSSLNPLTKTKRMESQQRKKKEARWNSKILWGFLSKR